MTRKLFIILACLFPFKLFACVSVFEPVHPIFQNDLPAAGVVLFVLVLTILASLRIFTSKSKKQKLGYFLATFVLIVSLGLAVLAKLSVEDSLHYVAPSDGSFTLGC